eukprot:TRINITY_DN13775_c0_g1_i1.p1 TRINITY_DN13775_c0_g1~~TRINITY_DN13775_c0_g1_i1.p1  ORF type:complete len:207 (+),score=61.08 TRINITY_DN13775_c0_g1_i1:86-706(+)
MTKIYVIYYSTYGHVAKLAQEVVKGAKKAGVEVELYQVPETLSEEILAKMHAPPKADVPVIDVHNLPQADGFLFGFPTRFGAMAAQFKAFFDATGSLWSKGALAGKPAGFFFSTATQNGGQETTALTSVTQLAHHGMVFVPIGYTTPLLFSDDAIRGGSPYGAGTLAGGDGSRQPSEKELAIAEHQGEYFAKFVDALQKGRQQQSS